MSLVFRRSRIYFVSFHDLAVAMIWDTILHVHVPTLGNYRKYAGQRVSEMV